MYVRIYVCMYGSMYVMYVCIYSMYLVMTVFIFQQEKPSDSSEAPTPSNQILSRCVCMYVCMYVLHFTYKCMHG